MIEAPPRDSKQHRNPRTRIACCGESLADDAKRPIASTSNSAQNTSSTDTSSQPFRAHRAAFHDLTNSAVKRSRMGKVDDDDRRGEGTAGAGDASASPHTKEKEMPCSPSYNDVWGVALSGSPAQERPRPASVQCSPVPAACARSTTGGAESTQRREAPPPPPPRSFNPQPYASPTKSTMLPPPPPLVAILERQQAARMEERQQQQQQQQRVGNPRQHFMLGGAHDGGPSLLLSTRQQVVINNADVPPPPPLHVTSTETDREQQQQQKVLTKYFFLKNFTVKPKTPGSSDKVEGNRRGGQRRRRGDVSPLPVAPAMPEEVPVAAATRSKMTVMPNEPQLADRFPNTQDNTHRTIPTLAPSQRPTVALRGASEGSHSPVGGNPLPSARMGALAALAGAAGHRSVAPLTPPSSAKHGWNNGAARRQNLVSGPSAAAGVATFLDQQQRRTNKPTCVVFPTPLKQLDVARSLMGDLDEMLSPQARAEGALGRDNQSEEICTSDDLDDDDDGEQEVFPHQLNSRPLRGEEALPTPGRTLVSPVGGTGCGLRPRRFQNSCEAAYPADNDMAGTPSMELPSPTTLGGSSGDRTLLRSGQSPHSVASTAEGSEPFDLLEFGDDYVSPMTDEDEKGRAASSDLHPTVQAREREIGGDLQGEILRCARAIAPVSVVSCLSTSSPSQDRGRDHDEWALPPPSARAMNSFANFFATSGICDPSVVAVKESQLLQEHSRLHKLLLQNYTKNLLLGVIENAAFVDCAVMSFTHTLDEALDRAWSEKTNMLFHAGYVALVGVPMMVSLEWHGRLLGKMQRDLFMRAVVRKFLRTAPRQQQLHAQPVTTQQQRVRTLGIESLNNRHRSYCNGSALDEEGGASRRQTTEEIDFSSF